MKNIHVLPTDKSSRIFYSGNNQEPLFSKEPISFRAFERSPQHIYITSDEDIKEGDWFITDDKRIEKCAFDWKAREWHKKIILTTDQDLIKDGVRVIDDEFLEWFVKNPSCEWVEINKTAPIRPFGSLYIIIVPNTTQEIIDEDFSGGLEMGQIIPKQETLNEVAERVLNLNELDSFRDYHYKQELYTAFIVGIKYQQKHSYSEEDMKLSFEAGRKRGNSGYPNTDNFRQPNFEEFIKQFEK